VLSVLLLVLFIRPLQDIKKQLEKSSRFLSALKVMRRMIRRNRNLLMFTLLCTFTVVLTIAVMDKLSMRAVIYLGAIDGLVRLQCITMSFDYLTCNNCSKSEEEPVPSQETVFRDSLEFSSIITPRLSL